MLPREAHVTINDISSSKAKGQERKGLTPLSPQTIKRLEKKGAFPQSHRYKNVKGRFYILGEVLDWLENQTKDDANKMNS